MSSIVAIDLGTTYFKFARFSRDGDLLTLHRLAPPIRQTPDGRVELEADAFAAAIASGLEQLGRQRAEGLDDVAALSFATQTNSFLLLDADDRPLTPLVIWTDRRAVPAPEPVARLAAHPRFRATTGVPELAGEFMVAKLCWFRAHHGELWRRARRVMLISDYLGWLCTGRRATEGGAAALTGLLDIGELRWWPDALDMMELDTDLLPEPHRAGSDLGPVGPAGARFGLPKDCRFVVGCLDQYAGPIGVGNVRAGGVSETTGTVLASVRCVDALADGLPPGVFQGPSFAPGLYWRMVFGSVSANYLHWYREHLPDRPEFDDLTAQAGRVADAGGLQLRTDPPGDPATAPLATVFDGITPQHERGHFVRCILEAVADALARQIDAVGGGEKPDLVRSAGGAARSRLWLGLKAARLGVPLAAAKGEEPTARGAAILAEAALSGRPIPAVVDDWVELAEPVSPDGTNWG